MKNRKYKKLAKQIEKSKRKAKNKPVIGLESEEDTECLMKVADMSYVSYGSESGEIVLHLLTSRADSFKSASRAR